MSKDTSCSLNPLEKCKGKREIVKTRIGPRLYESLGNSAEFRPTSRPDDSRLTLLIYLGKK